MDVVKDVDNETGEVEVEKVGERSSKSMVALLDQVGQFMRVAAVIGGVCFLGVTAVECAASSNRHQLETLNANNAHAVSLAKIESEQEVIMHKQTLRFGKKKRRTK